MPPPGKVQAGLGTRVAVRTFVIFGLSAALPVALFALIGYFFVSKELQRSAHVSLEEASKRYGVALNERLIQAETLMIEAARIELESAGAGPGNSSLLHRMQILTALMGEDLEINERTVPSFEMRLPPGWYATRALQSDVSGGVPRVRLIVTVSDGTREVRLISDPTDRAFWDPETALPDTRVCVHVRNRPLHCESGEVAVPADTPMQRAEWTLYLKPRYGAEAWIVRVEQPRHVALAALHSFRITLPIVALLAIIGALLLSFTHIRRIHRPLMLLAAGARRMSRGQFGEPVQIVSDDEFASVGRALNNLGKRLKHQFSMMSALQHIDRQILEHPTFEPVVLTLLPRMPRLLGCRAAAVLVEAGADTPAQLLLYRSGPGNAVQTPHVAGIGVLLEQIADLDAERCSAAVALPALGTHCPGIDGWLPSPIIVDGQRRGVLLAGYRGAERSRPRVRRQLRGIAHRLAVALGNEDRERALVRHAYFDPLTELPNRQLFRDRIEQELLRSRREMRNVALLYIDLDHFKNFNETLGHSAGDALLRGVAARLLETVREGDTLSRLGGDEFALVCPGVHSQQAAAIANKALAQLRAPFEIGEASYIIQASIGIAIFPGNGSNTEELLRRSSAAMYRAKQAGRGRIAFFEEGMNQRAERRMLVEQRLRSALDNRDLTLAYQPKLDSIDLGLRGFEALARWHDAELGAVSPGEFIPIAEEAGLIGRVGAFALEETCRALTEWRRLGLAVPHCAVNVSVHQLRDPLFPSFVHRCLTDAGLPAMMLELEITESTLATDDAAIVRSLNEIRDSGVRIAMDDFGTGYSSLASLRELPVDVLKIDRSFVMRSCDSMVDEALLRGLIELAHTLGKTVVAEGVETEAQLQLLRELGCDVVQGYLLGRPMSPERVPGLVGGNRPAVAWVSLQEAGVVASASVALRARD